MLVGGNIGHALSAQVDDSTDDTIHVVEASSFQLESIETFHPWIAVLLNFSPDHLDRHASVEEYAAAKARIFANQTAADWAVLNADDPASLALARTRAGAAAAVLDERRRSTTGIVRRRRRDRAPRPTAAIEPLVPLTSVSCSAAICSPTCWRPRRWRRSPASTPAAMTRGGRRLHRPRARARAGRRRSAACGSSTTRRRPTSRRRAAPSRASATALVVILGGRFKGGDFARSRRAAGGARTRPWSRSANRAPLIARGARVGGSTVHEAADMRQRGAARRSRSAVAGQHGAAGAGVRQLRHVPRLRGARAGVQAGSAEAARRNGTARVSSEQSSVRSVR